MKTVKLLARSEEDETVEQPVELSFEDAEIENLRLFMRNFERFKDADLIQKGMPELKKMGWDTKQGQGLTWPGPSDSYPNLVVLKTTRLRAG